jgi:hypothetical protein
MRTGTGSLTSEIWLITQWIEQQFEPTGSKLNLIQYDQKLDLSQQNQNAIAEQNWIWFITTELDLVQAFL